MLATPYALVMLLLGTLYALVMLLLGTLYALFMLLLGTLYALFMLLLGTLYAPACQQALLVECALPSPFSLRPLSIGGYGAERVFKSTLLPARCWWWSSRRCNC